LLRRQYRAGHGVQLSDAITAATARTAGAELHTLNVKHYPVIPNLAPAYVKP